MPCDQSPCYIGSSKPADSPIINVGSRRSVNKIGSSVANSINSSSSSSNSSNSSNKSANQSLQAAASVGSSRNNYGTVVMAPRPLHSTTTFSSTSCSSTFTLSSSSSSSSSSSASSTVSSSFSPSSFDRAPPPNGSANSSSSLILILDRPASLVTPNPTITDEMRNSTQRRSNHNSNSTQRENVESANRSSSPLPEVIDDHRATSSLETLTKKKKKKPGRCGRRKNVALSSRDERQMSLKLDEKFSEQLSQDNVTNDGNPLMDETTKTNDGFVATSTLTKNRENGILSVMKNASRSAGKIKLQSSVSSDTMIHETSEPHDRDPNRKTIHDSACYTPNTTKTRQSTISVASIRGTNMINVDSGNNGINNDDNDRTTIGGSSMNVTTGFNGVACNFATRVRCNVPSTSAPVLHHRHRQQTSNLNRTFSHSAIAQCSHSLVPMIHDSSARTVTSSVSSPWLPAKHQRKTMQPITTVPTTRCSPVKSSITSFPGFTVFPTGKSTLPINQTAFEPVNSASSLKSSSFGNCKTMEDKRGRTSIHASLGQLPISSSSGISVVGTNNASLDNIDDVVQRSDRQNVNVDAGSMTIALYSSGSPIDATTLSPHTTTTRTSLDRICYSTGASTVSSVSSKTPLAMPSIGNNVNVATAFKNSLVPFANNNNNNNNSNNNNNNSNNNNNNNGRCNHLSGTCNGTCNGNVTTSQTSSTLTRSPNLVNGVASTSSWTNNSTEQETDYVVDRVQGNAYHKGQFLGKGGFARVYLMTDVANGNQYACKIIPKNRMQKIHIQKIAREIMIHKELNHVNVVQMHHYFEDNINVYMLLEPCPRKSLMHVLKYRGKVTEPEARYYMKQMVTGVAYIHSQKVVHRDLKPGNMFLSDGMIVKIGDFGLATRPDGQRRRVTICGTPNYIAPEVLYKQAYSYEADVWALGCILYALLAGQPPFDTATLKETYARICKNRYKKLDDNLASRSGQDLIRWLLQPIPELRPSLERVKEHAYLTVEYVPTKLPHTCCYRTPTSHAIPSEQAQLERSHQLCQSGGNPTINRGIASIDTNDRNKREIVAGTLMQKSLHHVTNGTVSQSHLESTKIVDQKKPKVGNWLFRKLPKLPRFRQRLSRLLCPEHKKPDSVMMYRALEACLAEIRCTRAQENPMLVDRIAPLFVTKWIDYSNKYGLGFQLSDRSVGVLFNDSTKMSYTHDRRRVEYATTDDDVTRYRRELDVPSTMEEKLELLRHFTHYMDNFLTNGGEVKEQRPTTKLSRTNSSSVPRMRRWLRTDKAIVMELTVPLLQVNFFVDHSKIVVSEGIRGRGYLVTYIDGSRQASSYWLNDLRDLGCTAELYERLHYVCKVIAELENEAIFDVPSSVTTNQQHRKSFVT